MQILVVGGSAPTHIRPHVALVDELVARGHAVTYVCGDPVRALVTSSRVVTYPTVLPTRGPEDSGVWPEDPVAGMRLFLEDNIAALPTVCAQARPDLVLYETGGYAGAVAAHAWSVPAAALSPAMVAWEGFSLPDELMRSPAWQPFADRFTVWFEEHGMPRSWQDTMGHPEHGLALIPRVLQPEADKVGPHWQFVGPCLDERQLTETFTPTVSDRKILYVAFGTAYTDRPHLYAAATDAVAGEGWHVILSTGGAVELPDLPGSVEVHERVPQLAVLARADAFVTHAGMGSATEALWQGVPMVAIPAAVDQFTNANMLQAIGAGVHLPEPDATPDTIRAALGQLQPIGHLQTELRQTGGANRAADAVEVLIA